MACLSEATTGSVGILLAAGQSRRFGADKLLHRLPTGLPIVIQALRHLQAAVPQLLVVSRPQAAELNALLAAEQVSVIQCAHAERGMSASLACGIQASQTAHSWVVALADMPFIQVATIQQVVTCLQQGAAIVAPTYQGQRGHPVGFHRQFATQLQQLDGDVGAKTLLQQHQPALTLFDSPDRGVLRDIDVPEDLIHS